MLTAIRDGRTDLIVDHLAAGGAADARIDELPLLAWCAHHGDVSALRLLLAHGASLDTLGANFDLNGAVFHHHWQLCEFLIEQGANVNHALPESGETPLHIALSRANRPRAERIAELLLRHAADPNARTHPSAATSVFMRDARTRGETPLHRAAAFASARCIARLLAAGADPAARDSQGDTPLSWASWHLRPAPVLRALCHGRHTIHPDNDSSYDHGQGWQLRET